MILRLGCLRDQIPAFHHSIPIPFGHAIDLRAEVAFFFKMDRDCPLMACNLEFAVFAGEPNHGQAFIANNLPFRETGGRSCV